MENKIDFDSKEFHPMTANVKQLRTRLEQLDVETLKSYQSHHGAGLGKNLSSIVQGLIYRKTPKEMPADDPHPDGWYDR